MCDSVKCIDLRNGFVWVHRLCGWINVDTKRSSRVMPKFLIPNRIVALALALALALDVLKRVNRAQVICTFQFDARDSTKLCRVEFEFKNNIFSTEYISNSIAKRQSRIFLNNFI
jgi:hypothetical protein